MILTTVNNFDGKPCVPISGVSSFQKIKDNHVVVRIEVVLGVKPIG